MEVVPRFFALRLVSCYFFEVIMEQFQVKQHFTFGGEKFDIRDSFGNLAYQVEDLFSKFQNDLS